MNSSQKVCKFFKNGNCKYGNSCNFLHTSLNTQPQKSSGSSSYNIYTTNRYSQLSTQPIKTDYSQPGSFSSRIRQNTNEQVSNSFPTQKVSLTQPSPNPLTQNQQTGSVTGNTSQKMPFSSVQPVSKSHSALHTIPNSSGATESVYSRISDLTSQEVDAFKAQRFVIGKIPVKPPPKELCH